MSNSVKIIPAKKWEAKKEEWLVKGRDEFREELLSAIRTGIEESDEAEFWREVGYFIDTFGIAPRQDLIAEHRAKSGWWANE